MSMKTLTSVMKNLKLQDNLETDWLLFWGVWWFFPIIYFTCFID